MATCLDIGENAHPREDAAASSGTEGACAAPESSQTKKPTCVIVLGMAGSGKTTLVQRISTYLTSRNSRPYIVNLDPATHAVPYPVNIDIRDTVKYKDVMKEYSLGPNGAIMTSLNLFTIRCFNQVLEVIEKRSAEVEYVIFDTPGQIEVFTWSASGTIVTEALAAGFPTVVVYVVDTVRSCSPVTFMSNMLYACSILYKMKLPFIVAMNKTDVVDHSFAVTWMNDFEEFHASLDQESTYTSNLTRSLSLVLDQFYSELKTVGVSAATGDGFPEFFAAIDAAAIEYERCYKPAQQRLRRERAAKSASEQMEKLRRDLKDTTIQQSSAGPLLVPRGDGICLNPGKDEADYDDAQLERLTEEEDEEEKNEAASFRRFLEHEKAKSKTVADTSDYHTADMT